MSHISNARFEELKAGGLLPSPRGVALAVLEVTQRPSASIQDVTRLVQTDPAMAGRILRYANVALGGSARHIAALGQAIVFLGLFRIRQVVLGFSLIDQFHAGNCSGFNYEEYWARSLATGIAAQKLALAAQSPPDESFTCGLLAGIGRLGLATAFPAQYSTILDSKPSAQALVDAEISSFGIGHPQLSAEMLQSWGLPAVFADAVRNHEDMSNLQSAPGTRAFALTATLHLAWKIGQLLNFEGAERWALVPSLYNAAAEIGLEEDDLPPLIETVVKDWLEWTKELKLPSKYYADIRELLAAPPTIFVPGGNELYPLSHLHIALIIGDKARCEKATSVLQVLGLECRVFADLGALAWACAEVEIDVLIIDLGALVGPALRALVNIREGLPNTLKIIALIPVAAEAGISQLLQAGATDFLNYDFTEAALIARLTNIQRILSLQGAVRTERELAVSSSGHWARANRRLLHEALTDVLTQLPNRRYGMDRFEQEWSIASSNNLPIACMMLDIDWFKRVNDERGHDIGDLVLSQLARVLEQSCRRSDILFRYGGEEFCCICPSTNQEEAALLAERILARVRGEVFGRSEAPFSLTLSIGAAEARPGMNAPAALIAAADAALYAAKSGGRNRVLIHIWCP